MLKEKRNFFKFEVECECISVSITNLVPNFFGELLLYSEDEDNYLTIDCSDRRHLIVPRRTSSGIAFEVFIENESKSDNTVEYYIDEGYLLEKVNLKVLDKAKNKELECVVNQDVYELCNNMEVEVELPPQTRECMDFIAECVDDKSIQPLLEVCYEELKDDNLLKKLHTLINLELL